MNGLVKGIVKHIERGDSKDEIYTHVHEAGYTYQAFENAYNEAVKQMQTVPDTEIAQAATPPPASPAEAVGYANAQPPVPASAEQPSTTTLPQSTPPPPPVSPTSISTSDQPSPISPPASPSAKKSHRGVLIAVSLIFVVTSVFGLVFLVQAKIIPWPDTLAGWFLTAPYSEEDLLAGIFTDVVSTPMGSVSLTATTKVAPYEADTYRFQQEDSENTAVPLNLLGITKEEIREQDISFSYQADADYDFSSLTSMNVNGGFDLDATISDMNFSVDVESKFFIDDGVYVKVNDLNFGIFSLFLPNLEPIYQNWILVDDGERFADVTALPKFQLEVVESVIKRSMVIIDEELVNTPILSLRSDPEQITYDDAPAYRYVIALKAENLPRLIANVTARMEAEFGTLGSSSSNFDFTLNQSTEEYINYINAYAPINIIVSADGQLLEINSTGSLALSQSIFENVQLDQMSKMKFLKKAVREENIPPVEYLTSEEVRRLVPAFEMYSRERSEEEDSLPRIPSGPQI